MDAYRFTVHAAALPTIRSGATGYCLDVYGNEQAPNSPVDSWPCNGTAAQAWQRAADTVQHGSQDCLSTYDDLVIAGTSIVVTPCTGAPGQIWLNDQGGLYNPHSQRCLSLPDGQTSKQLVLASCSRISTAPEQWTPTVPSGSTCSGVEGQKVACLAEAAWTTWQTGSPSHEALLTQYTDGTPYEEWCADFVSYIYKAAGYPFTAGEANGWNENDANNIQNMGFTRHDPSGYTPKPGDVAYFDYDGGHVEIVVSGGKTPTFVYGDSGTVDPSTGNGQMAANTLLGDRNLGALAYYLSPN